MTSEFPPPVPEIPVADLAAALTYYRDCLGFTIDWSDLELGLAGISKGDCRMFLADRQFRKGYGNTGPMMVWLNLNSKEDVDELHHIWRASNARLMSVPESKPWGLHEFTAADPDGNLFRVFYDFATPERERAAAKPDPQPFYHGTKADLKPGDLIAPGRASNYGARKKAAYVYLSATLNAAVWGAELAHGEGTGRIYVVEPTGPIEDDPNLTDKKFPGNPTKSYRSKDPLRVAYELTDWQGHPAEELEAMRNHLEQLKQRGIEAIED